MGWDDRFRDLVEDLAQQAAGWRLAERDAEVAELSRAEYAEVELSARLRGSVGAPLVVDVLGVGPVDGRLHRVGQGWMLLAGETHDWVVATAAVAAVRGLADRVAADHVAPAADRLGLASVLRGLADEGAEVLLYRFDGHRERVLLGRIGADFAEVRTLDAGRPQVVPLRAVAAVRSG
jgi:hypothetical protein